MCSTKVIKMQIISKLLITFKCDNDRPGIETKKEKHFGDSVNPET